ncbi:hypothetical protein SeLEV6574_g07053 [Synchytrium endobioticum]|nr:hypothetical protein SeLEV6574_g07053 [Synchytrium endobioticum]
MPSTVSSMHRLLLVCLSTLVIFTSAVPPDPLANLSRKYDYKFSVKTPYYFPDDHLKLPYFDSLGGVIFGGPFIRLTPSVPYQVGAIWSKHANPHPEWQIKLSVKVSSKGAIGGRGLAVWYTAERMADGCTSMHACTSLYGAREPFTGLAIILDTADAAASRTTPRIYALEAHGAPIDISTSPSCLVDYHNRHQPLTLRITAANASVRVDYEFAHHGFTTCVVLPTTLPDGYYFGVSAQTGAHADDMDLVAFEAWQVNPPARHDLPLRPHERALRAANASVDMAASEPRILDAERLAAHIDDGYDDEDDEDDGDEDGDGDALLDEVRDSQHRILEAVAALAPDSAQMRDMITKLDALGSKLDAVSHKQNALEQKMNVLIQALSASQDVVTSKFDVLENGVRQVHVKLNTEPAVVSIPQHPRGSESTYMMILIGLSSVGVLLGMYTTWINRRNAVKEKKFI